jgi:AcrR family transcriptional regulator
MSGIEIPTVKGDLRRQAILKAAIEVFQHSGYSNASLSEIVRRSGGSKRSLYDYFGNKEALFSAVVEDRCAEILDTFSALTLTDKPVKQTLNTIGFKFAQAVLQPERVALFRIIVGEMPRFPTLGQRFYQAGPLAAKALLAPYLQRTFCIDQQQADVAAMQFLEMVKAPLHTALLLETAQSPSSAKVRKNVEQAVEIFLGGIGTLA